MTVVVGKHLVGGLGAFPLAPPVLAAPQPRVPAAGYVSRAMYLCFRLKISREDPDELIA